MDAHEPTHFFIERDETGKALPEPFVLALGISRGVSNEQYHGDRTAVSSTRLKGALISGQHFLAGLDTNESSEAMLFGSVLHARLLEPNCFDAEYMGLPKVSTRTKQGKEARSALEQLAGNRRTFPLQWLDEIDAIAANIRAHKTASALLKNAEKEVAFCWIDKETGLKLKAKADLWSPSTFEISDLKSTADATADAFERQCVQLRYPLSAAMYREGVYQLTGERSSWSFIACEKTAPHGVAVYRASEDFLRRGDAEFRRALRNLAEWKASGVYPGLQKNGEAEVIGIPRWY